MDGGGKGRGLAYFQGVSKQINKLSEVIFGFL